MDYTSFNELSRMQLDGETSTANVWITQTYTDGTRRPLTTQADRAKQVNHTVALRTHLRVRRRGQGHQHRGRARGTGT